jgi:hypothetical protein
MSSWCPNCGRQVDEGEKFCRQCGMPQHLEGKEATTWILTEPDPKRKTSGVHSQTTSPTSPPTGAAYIPPTPTPYYQPQQALYQQPSAPTSQPNISLGGWLSGGWQVYKENGALMSVATLLSLIIAFCTAGLLSGPLLMGLFSMAFKTMRGERPVMGDLFNWRGRFLQAFLTGLIFLVIQLTLGGAGNTNGFLKNCELGCDSFPNDFAWVYDFAGTRAWVGRGQLHKRCREAYLFSRCVHVVGRRFGICGDHRRWICRLRSWRVDHSPVDHFGGGCSLP